MQNLFGEEVPAPAAKPRKRRIEDWHWRLIETFSVSAWSPWQPADLEIAGAMHNFMAHGYVERRAVTPKPRKGAQYHYRLTAVGYEARAAHQQAST